MSLDYISYHLLGNDPMVKGDPYVLSLYKPEHAILLKSAPCSAFFHHANPLSSCTKKKSGPQVWRMRNPSAETLKA